MRQNSVDDKYIAVPAAAIPLIMLQRLEVQGMGGKLHYTRLGHIAYRAYEIVPFAQSLYRMYTTQIETRLRGAKIAKEYARVMRSEFNTIVEWLPERPKKIVGVGPGVAGLEAYLVGYYKNLGVVPEVFLIDQSRVDEVYYGFHEKAAAYNSLEVATQLLIDNGCSSDQINSVEGSCSADVESIREVDLITSLISWGFHYPVQTYIDFAIEALVPQGRLILDVRTETQGIDLLKEVFGNTQIIMSDPKFDRVLCIKA